MKTLDNSVASAKYERAVWMLCAAAGILYNSWPLGYVLDKQVAHQALASDLERAGHPYYWLFVTGDVLAALCIIGVAAIVRFRLRPVQIRSLIPAGLLVFGLFTAISSLLPYQCTITSLLRCGADRGNGLGLDAATSTVAALGLFASLAGLVWSHRKDKLVSSLTRITQVTLIAWTVSSLVFVELALTNLASTSTGAHLAQYVLLVTSGLALLVIGLGISAATFSPLKTG